MFLEIRDQKEEILNGNDVMISRDNIEILDAYPHYSDCRFTDPKNKFAHIERHIYLKPGHFLCRGEHCTTTNMATYDYSDRIDIWVGPDQCKKAAAYADVFFKRKTAAWFELYLSSAYMQLIDLLHIVAGVNTSGYPYQIFGYRIIS